MSTSLLKGKKKSYEHIVKEESLFGFLFGPATTNKQGKRINNEQDNYLGRRRVEAVAGCSGVELANKRKSVNYNANYHKRVGLYIR